MSIFVQRGQDRREVPSLRPFLRDSLAHRMVMDPTHMRPQDAAHCAWVGWGIGKGVTHVRDDVSVFATPDELRNGLHAELVQGFPNVDPLPLCYDAQGHVHGFGGFVRWVYFANPNDAACHSGVFGIDWSPGRPLAIGVAPSFHIITKIAQRACSHGVACSTEVALLNWRMIEPPEATAWRYRWGLRSIGDWIERAPRLFAPAGSLCTTCGENALHEASYCFECGAGPYRGTQEVRHGLEV